MCDLLEGFMEIGGSCKEMKLVVIEDILAIISFA